MRTALINYCLLELGNENPTNRSQETPTWPALSIFGWYLFWAGPLEPFLNFAFYSLGQWF
jgi:hypothetical protein